MNHHHIPLTIMCYIKHRFNCLQWSYIMIVMPYQMLNQQPSPYSTATKTVVNVDHVDHCAAPNINHPASQPTYSDTVSTGCYIDCYTASDINQPVPQTKNPEDHVDHNATSNPNHPTLQSSSVHINTVSTGSYVNRYCASIATQPLSCYKTATAKDGNNDDHQYTISSSKHPASSPLTLTHFQLAVMLIVTLHQMAIVNQVILVMVRLCQPQ